MSTRFNETAKRFMKTLRQYVPVVDRVHGAHHPEFHDVKKIFETIDAKLNTQENPDLNQEFSQLRQITSEYLVPGDVCETYEAVFSMLKALDKSYHS